MLYTLFGSNQRTCRFSGLLLALALLIAIPSRASQEALAPPEPGRAAGTVAAAVDRLPLSFEANTGNWIRPCGF